MAETAGSRLGRLFEEAQDTPGVAGHRIKQSQLVENQKVSECCVLSLGIAKWQFLEICSDLIGISRVKITYGAQTENLTGQSWLVAIAYSRCLAITGSFKNRKTSTSLCAQPLSSRFHSHLPLLIGLSAVETSCGTGLAHIFTNSGMVITVP